MAAANLGKFSIGHATVNQTCSTLMSTVHISFLRFQLVKEQRNTPGGLCWRSQHSIRDLTSRRLKSFMKKSALSYWSMKRRRANWETGYCQSPGDIWSWAKRECQPRRVQGQRYLQVRWMHTGWHRFKPLVISCSYRLLPWYQNGQEQHFWVVKRCETWASLQRARVLSAAPCEQRCSCLCCKTVLVVELTALVCSWNALGNCSCCSSGSVL